MAVFEPEHKSGKRIYIAGPMTGYKDYNYPAFHRAEEALDAMGWEPLNPARNFNGDLRLERDVYLRVDLKMLSTADAIALLPGWEHSDGARMEVCVARTLALKIYEFNGKVEPGVCLMPVYRLQAVTAASFARLVRQLFETEIMSLLECGQKEYAHNPDNAFANFDRVAASLELDRRFALLVYALKHRDGLNSHLAGHVSQRENVRGRINDIIVYMLILRAMCDAEEFGLLGDPEPSPTLQASWNDLTRRVLEDRPLSGNFRLEK